MFLDGSIEDHLLTGSKTNYYSVEPASNKFVQRQLLETSWVLKSLRLPGKSFAYHYRRKGLFQPWSKSPATRQADRDRSSIVELLGMPDNDGVGVVIMPLPDN